MNNHRISDETYKAGVAAFSEEGMIEPVATVGYYCLISLTLNSFEIPLEEGMEDPIDTNTCFESIAIQIQ